MYANSDLRPPFLLVSNPIDEREVYTRALRASGYVPTREPRYRLRYVSVSCAQTRRASTRS